MPVSPQPPAKGTATARPGLTTGHLGHAGARSVRHSPFSWAPGLQTSTTKRRLFPPLTSLRRHLASGAVERGATCRPRDGDAGCDAPASRRLPHESGRQQEAAAAAVRQQRLPDGSVAADIAAAAAGPRTVLNSGLVDSEVGVPAATLALALMHLQSNDPAAAHLFRLPGLCGWPGGCRRGDCEGVEGGTLSAIVQATACMPVGSEGTVVGVSTRAHAHPHVPRHAAALTRRDGVRPGFRATTAPAAARGGAGIGDVGQRAALGGVRPVTAAGAAPGAWVPRRAALLRGGCGGSPA